MITENLFTLKIHKLTQEQYDRELAAGRIDENALYLTPNEEVNLSDYATIEQLNGKADIEHSHEIEDIENLQSSLNELNEKIDAKSDSNHNHDDRYYTESEIDDKLLGKADASHTHDDRYYTETEINNLLTSKADKIHTHTKADVGLGNVENKSSATIRSELTKENVTNALGYTPPMTDTTYAAITNEEIDEICNANLSNYLDSIAAEEVGF